MSEAGYYRYPAIHADTLVFVCEDDLWTVAAAGGVARRLTANPGQATSPALSPDGALLAFAGRDEGHSEVYVMPAAGGVARRLTWLGARSRVVTWTPGGERIVFASDAGQPFAKRVELHAVAPDGSPPERLPTGPAESLSFGPAGGRVIGRHKSDLAMWKRYRGGQAGDLWIDPDGGGRWRRLIQIEGNLAMPLWLGERIYFIADHEGIGNLYSCDLAGADLRRHSHHDTFYVRHPASDGRRIVYQAGGDLFVYDPIEDRSQVVPIALHSPRIGRRRRFVDPARYLQSYDPHPEGHSLALTVRGKPFTMALWEGAVLQHGAGDGVRHRLTAWMQDGRHIALVSDAAGEEAVEIHAVPPDPERPVRRIEAPEIGRPMSLSPAPVGEQIALTNHRQELVLVDPAGGTARVLDRSPFAPIQGPAWSPDGAWLAYSYPDSPRGAIIRLLRLADGAVFDATRAILRDVAPSFDPGGRYLYFLSYRDFDPVADNLHFDLGFPRGMRPCLLTLQADLFSPFVPLPRAPGAEPGADDAEDPEGGAEGEGGEAGEVGEEADGEESDGEGAPRDRGPVASRRGTEAGRAAAESGDPEPPEPIRIDLEGIADRVLAFPVPEGHYSQIAGIEGKVVYTYLPIAGGLAEEEDEAAEPGAEATIELYDFETQDFEELVTGVSDFALSLDARTLVYRAGSHLRALKAGEKPPKEGRGASRKSGWVDLDRVRASVDPGAEWAQMLREAWRLQRDRFWTEDMSGVDWQAVYLRYRPLVDRIATRSELSDLLWEMQGELGTSHAYEIGGDYRPEPAYAMGFLGLDLRYEAEGDAFRVEAVVRGDAWDAPSASPLALPGIDVRPGDRLVAINGRPVGRAQPPGALLVHQADCELALDFAGGDDGALRSFTVRSLADERPLRYRAWVEANRARVHAATEGRAGYLHIPDMGPLGYAEFHRGFLAEMDRAGLIVDVRYNGGGHVSQLILEKLARRRLGYDVQRWGRPIPYPLESAAGPMLALTNAYAGSDGDVFCHAFKLMGLGPLIGERTWGGVIGIHVRDSLVDGGFTSQPEFSLWIEDIGWGLENRGAEPDIPVEYPPEDHVAGRDPQLDRAIAELERAIAAAPPRLPDFGPPPRRTLPKLPLG